MTRKSRNIFFTSLLTPRPPRLHSLQFYHLGTTSPDCIACLSAWWHLIPWLHCILFYQFGDNSATDYVFLSVVSNTALDYIVFCFPSFVPPQLMIALHFVYQFLTNTSIDCIAFCSTIFVPPQQWLYCLLFHQLYSVLCHHIYWLHYLLRISLVPPQPLLALRFVLQLGATTAPNCIVFCFSSFVNHILQLHYLLFYLLGNTTAP